MAGCFTASTLYQAVGGHWERVPIFAFFAGLYCFLALRAEPRP